MSHLKNIFILTYAIIVVLSSSPLFSEETAPDLTIKWRLEKNDIPNKEVAFKQLEELQLYTDYSPSLKARPAACPMHATSGLGVLHELREITERLGGSQCEQQNQPDFSYLQSLSTGIPIGLTQSLYGTDYYSLFSPLGSMYYFLYGSGFGYGASSGGGAMMGMGGGMNTGTSPGSSTSTTAHSANDGHGHRAIEIGTRMREMPLPIPVSFLHRMAKERIVLDIRRGRGPLRHDDTTTTTVDPHAAEEEKAAAATAQQLALNQELLMKSVMSQQQIKQLMDSVMKLSQNAQCVEEMKFRDLLPIVAGAVAHVSQLALLVPSPEAAGVGLGGMGVSLGLTLLYALLEAYDRWDWNDPKLRDDFMNVTCAFYDLRRQMSDSYAFSVNDSTLPARIDKHQEQLDKVKKLLEQKHKDLEMFFSKVKERKNLFLRERLGENSLQLWEDLQETLIRVQSEPTSFHKLEVIGPRASQLVKAIEINKASKIGGYYFYEDPLLELLKDLEKRGALKDLLQMSEESMQRQFLEPTGGYLFKYFVTMDEERKALVKDWFEFKFKLQIKDETETEIETDNKSIYEKAIESHYEIISRYEAEVARLQNAVQIMKGISLHQHFKSSDEGTSIIFNTMQEYKNLQEYIYEKRGNGFVHYLASKASSDLRFFDSRFFFFKHRYLSHPANDRYWAKKPKRKQRACRVAQSLLVKWKHAETAAELGYDFFEANMAILHPNTKWLKRLFQLPMPWPSGALRLRVQLASVNKANEVRNNPHWYSSLFLYLYGFGNLGKSMDHSYRTVGKARQLEAFLEDTRYGCSSVLNI